MASIYRRGQTYWVHYYVNGKSVSKSLKTKSERVAQAKRKQLEALEVLDQLPQPSDTPIVAVVQSFCEHLFVTQSKKGGKNDLSCLRVFFGPCCPALEFGSRVPGSTETQIRNCLWCGTD